MTAYDGIRIAAIAAEAGVRVDAARVDGTERPMRAELAQHSWPLRPNSPVPVAGGVRFLRRVLELADADGNAALLDAAAELLWKRHLENNLWSRVLGGVPQALGRLNAAGVRLAVVSNSEGTVEAMLRDVGLRQQFEVVVDSWAVGITKPDPRIFHHALTTLNVAPGDAVMVGDSPTADVGGAAAAGIRGALLDPFDLHPATAAPRYPDFAAFADAVLSCRTA